MPNRSGREGGGIQYCEENLLEKSDLLLKSNPIHRKVPVLIHDGKPVCESLIILQYIDEVWPGKAGILPADPYARAQARFWADFVDKKIFGATYLWRLKGEAKQEAKREFIANLKTLEEEIGGKKYFGGETFGLTDIALVPFTSYFYSYEVFFNLSVEKECPGIAEWAERCKERESVAKSLYDPKKTYEHFRSLMKRFGAE